MNMPLESKGDAPTEEQFQLIKTAGYRVFEQQGATPALQFVARLRRSKLPTLPKLSTPDPDNPTKKIEEADALIIGPRIIESPRRKQEVTLVALFPIGSPFVELRSYRGVVTELPPEKMRLVPEGLPMESHLSIFTNAGKVQQRELIGLILAAIYSKSQQLAK